MNKRTIEIAVGFLFLLGVGAFILLAMKVSGLASLNPFRNDYIITADFDNVGGLKPRARVAMAGVTIGRVVSIRFDPKNYHATVTMSLNKKMNSIPNDTKANILTAGLLGDNYIGLSAGFSDDFFKPGDHIALEDTESAVALEQLVQKFLSGQASGYNPADSATKTEESGQNHAQIRDF